jgi:hypothetical protein
MTTFQKLVLRWLQLIASEFYRPYNQEWIKKYDNLCKETDIAIDDLPQNDEQSQKLP